ncbi:MAG: hypothetical protein KJO81_01890 [Gammaproteobacteria bacterium]|nr:hypothetical protein [Gammaproteobacteria bacterium]
MEFQSNADLFEAIKKLQSSLSSSGNEKAGELLGEGMLSLNGLTDGWALLLESINTLNKRYGATLSQHQCDELNKIHKAVHQVVYRA